MPRASCVSFSNPRVRTLECRGGMANGPAAPRPAERSFRVSGSVGAEVEREAVGPGRLVEDVMLAVRRGGLL